MRKEDKLLGLREEILTKKSEQTPIEQFQNTAIRPTLIEEALPNVNRLITAIKRTVNR